MALVSDLTDKTIKLAIAYGRHAVKGTPTKHYSRIYGTDTYLTAQWAGGDGIWEGVESAYIKGNPINMPVDFRFHNGLANDAPDDLFPSDDPHPFASYWAANTPLGVTADDLSSGFFGIFKCLRTADYDNQGRQIDVNGTLVPSGADPRDYYFYDPNVNPAIVSADQIIRWGKRLPIIINWSAWDTWKQYNKESISWDDGKYIPANLVLTPISGGSLTPGTTYYIRLAGENGSELSSAGREWEITLPSGASGIKLDWIVQSGATPSGFRIYVSTASGGQHGYFHIAGGSTLTYNLLTLSGTTAGDPPAMATSGLLRQVPRFQANLFFVPPYNLRDSLDRIFQVSCADQQWANGKLTILSPADRAPVFTVDLTQVKAGTFKTYPIDRRTRPNQIQVNYRDLDDPYLAQADPLIIPNPDTTPDSDPRIVLQQNDGQISTFTIEGGGMTRSQAQRVGTFWYRWYCNMDQMADLTSSPKSYHVLPGDVINVTNDTPNWTDIKFKAMKKEEHVQDSLGDPFTLQLYRTGLYSDTDHGPIERPLPVNNPNPFAAPPAVTGFVIVKYDVHGIRLSWDAVGSTVQRPIYEIQRLDADVVDGSHDWYERIRLDATAWTDAKLPLVSHYRYRIRTISAFGTPGAWTELVFDLTALVGVSNLNVTVAADSHDTNTLTITLPDTMTAIGRDAVKAVRAVLLKRTHISGSTYKWDIQYDEQLAGSGAQRVIHMPFRSSIFTDDFTNPTYFIHVYCLFPADDSVIAQGLTESDGTVDFTTHGCLVGGEAQVKPTNTEITAQDLQSSATPQPRQLVQVAGDATTLQIGNLSQGDLAATPPTDANQILVSSSATSTDRPVYVEPNVVASKMKVSKLQTRYEPLVVQIPRSNANLPLFDGQPDDLVSVMVCDINGDVLMTEVDQ